MNNKIKNRWLVILGAALIQICIGSVYSWSLFNQPLIDKFGWDKSDIVFTFSIVVFVFAFTTIFSGRLQDKIGPKKVALFGGVLYGVGLILSSFANHIFHLYLYYGVIAGIGIGFAYVCPISTCIKWFPDRKGFITGVVVGAFGLGSLIFKSLIEFLLINKGVSNTFLYLGIIYIVLITIGGSLLSLPPEGYLSELKNNDNKYEETNYTVSEMIKTKAFPLLWIVYLFGCVSGLLVIGLAKDIGVQLAGLSAIEAANSIAIISVFNAGGRLVWATLSDKIGRIKVLFILFTLTSISMFSISIIELNIYTFFIFLSVITFCFGGLLSVFPTIAGEFYGSKNVGANYGIIYQAYGLSALVGPIIITNTSGLKPTFIIAATLSLIAAGITFIIKKPTKDLIV